MLVSAKSWNNNMLKVRTWLVVAMRLQARHLPFRLCTSSNMPFVGMSVVIRFSGQFQWKWCFPSCNPGWRSTSVNWYNSRRDCNLGSSSTSQKWTVSWFSNTTRHELQGARGTWGSLIRLQRVPPCFHAIDLPLAQKLTVNNNPNLSNGKADISKKNAINVKSVLTVQQSQFATSYALTTRICHGSQHERCRKVPLISNGYLHTSIW
jgi:hypothetical protein